jgi:lipopolysaccharide/colanic/teichoic acid biosynthesis glycosyltransferase
MHKRQAKRNIIFLGSHHQSRNALNAVYVRRSSLDVSYWAMLKAIFDLAFSIAVLLFFAPLFCIIAILIKLDSPGPVFYCPVRVGKSGNLFKVFKFRSMRECDALLGGTQSTEKNDPRVSALGKILRKYSLDELPQFINVIKGEMSVIGPRPHRKFLHDEMEKSIDRYSLRLHIKPGITGWAQVNGWRGPTSTIEQKVKRTEHDLWYIENWTFAIDLKIIFLTLFGKKTHSGVF